MAMWIDTPTCSERCATDLCCRPASSRLEAGGVGSYYCESCRVVIERAKRFGTGRHKIVSTEPDDSVIRLFFLGDDERR